MPAIRNITKRLGETLNWKRPNARIKNWTKMDIINELGVIHGYGDYLEICTSTTGNLHAHVNRSIFGICDRLMYRCPDTFDDGMEINFRTTDLDIEESVRVIKDNGLSYDVILVDSFHEYQTSYRDLRQALTLAKPDGTIIVHDCLPPNEELAKPTFMEGAWCGVTYKAFLDFVTTEPSVEYCTIDTDCGCGVIRRTRRVEMSESIPHRSPDGIVQTYAFHDRVAETERSRLVGTWKSVGSDYRAAFRILRENQRPLLNLVSVDDFLRAERDGASLLMQTRPAPPRCVGDPDFASDDRPDRPPREGAPKPA
jgi:hypothetical protein